MKDDLLTQWVGRSLHRHLMRLLRVGPFPAEEARVQWYHGDHLASPVFVPTGAPNSKEEAF